MSSPMKLYNSTYSSDFEEIYASTEPSMCDCQNQLAHFDWGGNRRDDLPELCRRTLGIGAESISPNNIDPDYEWKQVILRRARRSQLKDLNEKVEGNTLADTNREVDIVADKGGAGDLTRTKGRKRRMSNEDTWTSKKSKGLDFRIKFHVGKKRSTVKISVKVT